jgi:hypothetical protein
MTNTKMNKKAPKTLKGQKKPKVRTSTLVESKKDLARDIELISKHISDPCNSDLSASGLPGQKGMVARFVSDIDVSFGTGTSQFFSYFPSNTTYALSGGNSTHLFTPILGQYSGPGSSFFNSDSTPGNTFRPLGACIEVMNYTSIMNRGGTWAVLHTPANVIDGVQTNYQNLIGAANERGLFGSGTEPLQFLWRPGYMDDAYSTWAGAGEEVDYTDRNAITLVLTGPDDNVQNCRIRITLVCEWLPNVGLTTTGLVAPTVGGSAHNLRSSQIVGALDKASPGWFGPMMSKYGPMAAKAIGNQLLKLIT